MTNIRTIFLLVFAISMFSFAASAQKQIPPKAPPSPGPTPQLPEKFFSTEDKFLIELPEKPTSVREATTPDELQNMVSRREYKWDTKDAVFTVTHAVFKEALKNDNDLISFGVGLKESVVEKGGKLLAENAEKIGIYGHFEFVIEKPDGAIMITRWRVSYQEYYMLGAALKQDSVANRLAAFKVMDTFRMIVAAPVGRPKTSQPVN